MSSEPICAFVCVSCGTKRVSSNPICVSVFCCATVTSAAGVGCVYVYGCACVRVPVKAMPAASHLSVSVPVSESVCRTVSICLAAPVRSSGAKCERTSRSAYVSVSVYVSVSESDEECASIIFRILPPPPLCLCVCVCCMGHACVRAVCKSVVRK